MPFAIDLAKRISKDLEKNWLPELEEKNLHKIFESLFRLNVNITQANTLVCAVIFSYDKNSKWIDLRQDGITINKNVLLGLSANVSENIFREFIEFSNEDINDTIGLFLDTQNDWRFITIRKMVDFHAKTMSQKDPDLKDVDEEKKPKILENMSRAMKEGVFQREAADKLIEQIEKEYVSLNHKTESDFGLKFTNNGTKADIMSWRQYIRQKNERKEVTSAQD